MSSSVIEWQSLGGPQLLWSSEINVS